VQDAGYRLGQLAIAVACVFLPCFFMGVTFPLLSRAFVDAPGGARFPAALYGWNTLGACLGVLACQFLLLPGIGHGATFAVMLGLNLAIAVLFLTGRSPAPAPPAPAARTEQAGDPAVLLVCATLGGLLAGALEGDMFKRMSLVISNGPGALAPAISFWAILGIFLASVVVWRSPRIRLLHLKIAFVGAALWYGAASWLMYPAVIARLTTRDAPGLVPLAQGVLNTFPDSAAELFLFVGACIFVPYFLVSLLLPWVCNGLQGRRAHLGLAYGLNTAAFCIGLIGFTLLAPLVNVFYSLKLAWVLLACGIALLVVLPASGRARGWQPALAAAAFIAGCAVTPSGFDAGDLMPGSLPTRYPVSSLRSNGTHTTFVVHAPEGAYLYFGNTSMSGTVLPSQVYMRLMAHLPLLLQAEPSRALVICFGVGNTASAIATHEGIDRIDVVDLNRNVFATAPEFAATNGRVYADPRVRLINDDGRSFLRMSRDSWDLITSEPPPPMQAGVYRLYSREYYEDVVAHLTPGGMMTQWLPAYQMPPDAVDEAIATFVAVFPHALLYSGAGPELVLLGSREPIGLDRLWERFPADGAVREDLAAIGVTRPLTLALRVVRTGESLRREYGRGRTISDERNDLEHMFLTTARTADLNLDRREVLDWMRTAAPRMAAVAAPALERIGRQAPRDR
jgi:hypothetical protein